MGFRPIVQYSGDAFLLRSRFQPLNTAKHGHGALWPLSNRVPTNDLFFAYAQIQLKPQRPQPQTAFRGILR
jgi:hypothetical protein